MNIAPIFNLKSIENIIKEIGNPIELWNLTKSEVQNLDIDKKDLEKLCKKLAKTPLDKLNSIISSINAKIVVYSDNNFPKRLGRYKHQPAMLFYRGDLSLVDQKRIIAIVGTRKSSMYGEKVTKQLTREIATYRYTVITGNALGIDSNVMKSSLEAGNKCISVLSTGIDKISPRQSEKLLNDIVDQGGCYLTEFPPGVAAFRSNYPIRAKLLAALATEIIVIEAPSNSGALLVAKEAFELRRNVFCVPSFWYDKNFWGSHSFIESGKAILLKSFKDVEKFANT